MLISWQVKMDIPLCIPFDDPDVATGQGTIAMEIIKELPTVDYILVPIGREADFAQVFPPLPSS